MNMILAERSIESLKNGSKTPLEVLQRIKATEPELVVYTLLKQLKDTNDTTGLICALNSEMNKSKNEINKRIESTKHVVVNLSQKEMNRRNELHRFTRESL